MEVLLFIGVVLFVYILLGLFGAILFHLSAIFDYTCNGRLNKITVSEFIDDSVMFIILGPMGLLIAFPLCMVSYIKMRSGGGGKIIMSNEKLIQKYYRGDKNDV